MGEKELRKPCPYQAVNECLPENWMRGRVRRLRTVVSGVTSQERQLKETGNELLSSPAVQNQNGLHWKAIPDLNDPAEADGGRHPSSRL